VFLGWLPPADRKRAAVQRPETISTYLLLCLVDSIFLHTVHNPVCPCRMNCCHGWLASVLFRQGQPVSSGRCRCIGKIIPPHVSDQWVLAWRPMFILQTPRFFFPGSSFRPIKVWKRDIRTKNTFQVTLTD